MAFRYPHQISRCHGTRLLHSQVRNHNLHFRCVCVPGVSRTKLCTLTPTSVKPTFLKHGKISSCTRPTDKGICDRVEPLKTLFDCSQYHNGSLPALWRSKQSQQVQIFIRIPVSNFICCSANLSSHIANCQPTEVNHLDGPIQLLVSGPSELHQIQVRDFGWPISPVQVLPKTLARTQCSLDELMSDCI